MRLNSALLLHLNLSKANKIWRAGAEMLRQVILAADKTAPLMTA